MGIDKLNEILMVATNPKLLEDVASKLVEFDEFYMAATLKAV